MKGQLIRAIAVVALCVAGRPSLAQTFYADLDTKEGHFSTWRAEKLGDARGCAFEAEIVEAYSHPRWLPGMTVSVRGSVEGERVSLRLFRPVNRESFSATVTATSDAGPTTTELDLSARVGKPMAISVRWSGTKVEYVVDQRAIASIERAFDVTAFEISASTADLQLRNLSCEEGQQTPRPAGATGGAKPVSLEPRAKRTFGPPTSTPAGTTFVVRVITAFGTATLQLYRCGPRCDTATLLKLSEIRGDAVDQEFSWVTDVPGEHYLWLEDLATSAAIVGSTEEVREGKTRIVFQTGTVIEAWYIIPEKRSTSSCCGQ